MRWRATFAKRLPSRSVVSALLPLKRPLLKPHSAGISLPINPSPPRRKLLAQVEARVGALEAELNRLTDAMNAAAGDAGKITELSVAYQKAQDELDSTYARWEALAAELEALTAGIT